MSDLVVIVPSRGRPEAARTLLTAFERTCTADTKLLFAVDDNDPTAEEYADLSTRVVGEEDGWTKREATRCFTLSLPSRTMVEALNGAAAVMAADPAGPFALGFLGDDHMPRTVGWDTRYLDALHELGSGIVYGNDLLQGHRLPTQCAMTTDIVRALGYMAPPAFTHLFVDNTWLHWGRLLGRLRYLSDVIVEHRHPIAGKAQWDDGYARVNAANVAQHDEATFNAYVHDGLEADVAKLQALLVAPCG